MTSERMIMVPEWLIEEAASLIEQAGLVGIGVSMAAPRLRAALDQPAAGEPVAPKEVGEVIVTLRDGMKCFAFEEYSEAYKLPEGLHYLYPAPPAAAHRDSFRTWLAAEMPVGTVIGNPAWWAERILKRIGAAAHGDEAVRALAGMTDLYSTAQDELDAVRRDAERYRWLRDPAYTRWGTMFKLYRAGAELDDAIDAAMRAQAGEGGEV